MYINSNIDIQTIKAISIADIALKLGITIKGNKSICYTGHDKHTPSLSFNFKKGLFKCFGCSEKGDSITLVMRNLNTDFNGACQCIIKEFNLSTYTISSLPKRRRIIPKVVANKKENEFGPNEKLYEWIIHNTVLSSSSRTYLKKRGFSDKNIDKLCIRDIESPNTFFKLLLKTWGKDELLKCGVAKLDNNSILKSVWWDHIILFPFFNVKNRIDYLQARRMSGNDPKYVNLKGVTPSIYNLNSLDSCEEGDKIFLCEGIPDTITAMELGHVAMGILGANGFKEEWVDYFGNFNISVIPDNDNAGKIFSNKIRAAFGNIGKHIRLIDLPENIKDLNEYFNKTNNRV